ncbi:MAG: bifunctional metallophosphatase/5'-nucleotidase [Desulfovibrionaceae bacterium]|nr:bifunctional metallophosphatase/5'-nucleotidase [Desulfovibrionaceae bacterium]
MLIGCLLLVQASCTLRQQQASRKADLLILHTNDTHSHIAGIDKHGSACMDDRDCRGGLARISAAVADAKKRGENVLALDAGDMFQGTLFYSVNKWPMLAEFNALMPWDAATLGNHEWDEGCGDLAKYIEARRPFPLLAANLKPKKGCPLLYSSTEPYIIRTIGGHKVGVIGLANDEVVGLASACPQTNFADRVESVRAAVRELEGKGVRRIILLTHIGLPDDRKLARSVDGVDVIVGGHTHSYLGPGSKEGPYPIVEKSPSGKPVLVVTAKRATQYLGELSCSFDSDGVLTSWSGQARELLPSDPRDEKISSRIAEYAASLAEYRSRRLGSHNVDLGPDGLDACREHECLTGMIFADAMLDFGRPYGAQMALCNSGGVRAALKKGDITQGDILTAFPFNGIILLREYSGEQIWEALEHGVADEGAIGPQMLQVAGLRYVVDGSKPAGKRVLKAEVLDGKGRAAPLRPRERYVVALPEYIAKGGDFFDMLTTGKAVSSPEPIDVDLLSAYLAKHSPLPKPATGRIIRK